MIYPYFVILFSFLSSIFDNLGKILGCNFIKLGLQCSQYLTSVSLSLKHGNRHVMFSLTTLAMQSLVVTTFEIA